MKWIVLALPLLMLSFTADAKSKFKCFQAYGKCMSQNPGKSKMCREQRKTCESGGASAGADTAAAKPDRATCNRRYSACLMNNPGKFKKCRSEKKTCLEGGPVAAKPKAEKPVASAPAASATPAATASVYKKEGGKDVCWEEMGKSCMKRDAVCKPAGRYFASKEDCMKCKKKYDNKVRRFESVFIMNGSKLKKCKPHRRDVAALGDCMNKLSGKEKKATQKYHEARVGMQKLAEEARASGIVGCGYFRGTY